MKHSELRLDTVYADNDGRPLMLLSLDKYVKPKVNYGTRMIRLADQLDKSFGVVILRQGYRSRPTDFDDLAEVARELREAVPAKEQMVGEYEVEVESLRLIADTWEGHLKTQREEAERRQASAEKAEALRQARADRIAQIEAVLPEGAKITMTVNSGWAQIPLTQLLSLATAAAPVEIADGSSFTPREMSLLAAGFDAAIATMRYEDGTPVDVVAVMNPYRAEQSPGSM